ncbi:MAG: hypothetical protein N2513_03780 [Deltaproteobacteria bacterium]|nr:hypothetical protein [Deltaproteobacteria bacterium]
MLNPEERLRIEELAYIPEHTVSLMTIISDGEAFFEEGFLYFKGDHWLIFVGYPIQKEYSEEAVIKFVFRLRDLFQFDYLWLICPKVPGILKKEASIYVKDNYYTLDLGSFNPPNRLVKRLEKVSQKIYVTRSTVYTDEHEAVLVNFVKEKKPEPFVKALYCSMRKYVSHSDSAILLNAYDANRNLIAFYVIDNGAKEFITYVVGCRKTNSLFFGVSDLIFLKMVELALEMRKKYIHLGLGVNEGIKRFKEKWGGVPSIPYEFVELRRKKGIFNLLKGIEGII